MNVYHNFEKAVEKYKDKPCAYFNQEETQLSYGELFDAAEAYASFLAENGIGKGRRVSVYLEKSQLYFCLYLALIKLGAIIHTIDAHSNLAEEITILKTFDAETIVSHSDRLNKLQQVITENEIPLLPVPTLEEIQQTPYPRVTTTAVQNDHPAVSIFTSGTTGDPKGILCSHENIKVAADCVRLAHQIGESDVALNTIPMSSINGQVTTFWAPLGVGCPVVLYQGLFSSYGIFSCIETYRVTWYSGIPTHYTIMLNSPVDPKDFDISSLQFMRSASAPLPVSIHKDFEKLYGIPIINTMGLSEMTGQVFANPKDISKRKLGSVGQPVNNEARVVDKEGNPLGPNHEGELIVTGKNLMRGYYDDPESTRKAIREGWLYTGDIATYDEDHFFFITGRKKDIVIVGGQNVSLKEVDDIIYGCQGVIKVATIGVAEEDSAQGETLIALVVKKDSLNLNERDIQKHCLNFLSKHKIPTKVIFVDTLPEGGTGKVLRAKAKKIYLESGQR